MSIQSYTLQLYQDIRNLCYPQLLAMQFYYKAYNNYKQFKINSQQFLSKPNSCKGYQQEYARTNYVEHFQDKRINLHFLGVTSVEEILDMHLVQNKECYSYKQAKCLNLKCQKHRLLKRLSGFLPQDKSFLDRQRANATEELDKSAFLIISRAPRINIRILIRPISLLNSLLCQKALG